MVLRRLGRLASRPSGGGKSRKEPTPAPPETAPASAPASPKLGDLYQQMNDLLDGIAELHPARHSAEDVREAFNRCIELQSRISTLGGLPLDADPVQFRDMILETWGEAAERAANGEEIPELEDEAPEAPPEAPAKPAPRKRKRSKAKDTDAPAEIKSATQRFRSGNRR